MTEQRLIAAVDLERDSDIVIGAGLRLADRLKGRLTLVHVSEKLPYLTEASREVGAAEEKARLESYVRLAQKKLEELAAELAPKVEVQIKVLEGIPEQEILRAVTEDRADLLVVGTHARRGVDRWLLGSNAARLIRKSPVPVATVCTREPSYRDLDVKRILLATDFSEHARTAETWAMRLAKDFGADVLAVHVMEKRYPPQPPHYLSELGDESWYSEYSSFVTEHRQKLAQETAQRFKDAGVKVDVQLVVDEKGIAQELVGAVKGGSAQLVVMGTHGRTGFDRLVLGSIAETVVRYAPAVVLTVPNP